MRWTRGVGICGAALLLASCEVGRPAPRLADGVADSAATAAANAFVGSGPGDSIRATPAALPMDFRAGTSAYQGRWWGAHDEVELFASGRLLLHQGPYRVAGTYELLEPGRMLIIYQNALAAVPPGDYRVAVRGDSLSFCETDLPARCVRYARIAPGSARTGSRRVVDDGTPPRLAAPLRPDQYPPEARSIEATGVLKQAYTLQQTYRAYHGRYAATFEELREVGWEQVPLRHFHPVEIVRATGERLCIVARPRAADLWVVHIDAQGRIARGDDC